MSKQMAKVLSSLQLVKCNALRRQTLPLEEIPAGCLPPDYLLRGIIAGVRDGGNRMGVPTIDGSTHFHPAFRAKPTVIVGATASYYPPCTKGKAQNGRSHCRSGWNVRGSTHRRGRRSLLKL